MEQYLKFIPLEQIIFTLVALVVTLILSLISNRLVDIIFVKMNQRMSSQRLLSKTGTVRLLLKNIIDVSLFIMFILTVLSKWGVNIMPLLTGAGILGLGISFGSQTLVKDILSGFFIIVEDQFNVGDRIKVKDYEGEVVQVTLRLTVLRDKNENIIMIPNSEVTSVTRFK